MYKIFKTLILFIWIIDIFNIRYTINGVDIANYLDFTLPLNFWFWLLFLIVIPASDKIEIKTKED